MTQREPAAWAVMDGYHIDERPFANRRGAELRCSELNHLHPRKQHFVVPLYHEEYDTAGIHVGETIQFVAPGDPWHCEDCDRPKLCDVIQRGTAPCGRNAGMAPAACKIVDELRESPGRAPGVTPSEPADAVPEPNFGLLHAIDTACEIVKTGDARLPGGQPPELSLLEWRELYAALDSARRMLREMTDLRAAQDQADAREIIEMFLELYDGIGKDSGTPKPYEVDAIVESARGWLARRRAPGVTGEPDAWAVLGEPLRARLATVPVLAAEPSAWATVRLDNDEITELYETRQKAEGGAADGWERVEPLYRRSPVSGGEPASEPTTESGT